MPSPPPRIALAALTALAALILFTAHASEIWGGLVPCSLCLVERWPYRAAIAIGVIGLTSPTRFLRPALALLALAMLAAAAAALVHVGVEFAWWPSPLPQCEAPKLAGLTLADRLAAMPARPAKPCDEPTYLIAFLPISMAMMNLIAALTLMGGAALAMFRRGPAPAADSPNRP